MSFSAVATLPAPLATVATGIGVNPVIPVRIAPKKIINSMIFYTDMSSMILVSMLICLRENNGYFRLKKDPF